MFKNLKLRNKIVIPISIILVILMTFIVVFVSITTANLVDSYEDDRLAAASQAVRAYLAAYEQKTLIAASALGGSAELINLIHAGDRDAIWQYAVNRKDFFGIDEIIVGSADGIALARSHMRDSYGDNISGVPSVAAALNRQTITLYTPTPTATMVMTSTSPILDGDTLVGSIVVNFVIGRGVEETDAFLDALGATFDIDATVFNRDGESVSSTLIHPETGARAVGTTVAQNVSDAVLGRGEHLTLELNVFGMLPYTAYYFPLPGADGNPNAMFFVGVSAEYGLANILSQRIIMIIIGVAGLAVVMLLVLLIAGQISKPVKVLGEFMQVMSRDGDIIASPEEERILEGYMARKDELGSLFSSFQNLINVLIEVKDDLGEVASGNLAVDVNVRSDRDILSITLAEMVGNLNRMFSEVSSVTYGVASGSKQMADGSQALAQSSTAQATSVEQLSASISEIAKKTEDNAKMASRAASLASNIKASAEKGSSQMDDMMAAVRDINESGKNISKVIKSIDDIAFQTNILALNAAVEAARAGQHGKGFAVVAEEVRNLAAKSAEAAKDTESLIADSVSKAELGSKIADETSASLIEIVEGIDESSRLVGDIARYSEEQATGIAQINTGIDQVANVVQQTSASAEQSAAVSHNMNDQSTTLERLISQFRLKDQQDNGMLSIPSNSSKADEQQDKPDDFDDSSDSFGKY
ncbi:MAG: methyl-accepting chemotaxis protein [Oscillospiraceae bacterium]|nr:methyl-accepting chemotaxis protein [Oscillospiraceae bacterium]